MFTHARCGGVLLPIEDPPWFKRPNGAAARMWEWRQFVRCRRCGLEGEVVEVPE